MYEFFPITTLKQNYGTCEFDETATKLRNPFRYISLVYCNACIVVFVIAIFYRQNTRILYECNAI